MTEDLRRRLRLAERAMYVGVSPRMKIDVWTMIANLAAEENEEAVFDKAVKVLSILESNNRR